MAVMAQAESVEPQVDLEAAATAKAGSLFSGHAMPFPNSVEVGISWDFMVNSRIIQVVISLKKGGHHHHYAAAGSSPLSVTVSKDDLPNLDVMDLWPCRGLDSRFENVSGGFGYNLCL